MLDHANALRKVDDVLAVAVKEDPDDEALNQARDSAPAPAIKGPEAKAWSGPTGASQLEKIISARSSLVSVSNLETGILRAKSVVRVKRQDGSSDSGFVTAGNILIANNHVLPSKEIAKTSVAQFNYQQTPDGLDATMQEVALDPDDLFLTSDEEDDWTAVRLAPGAGDKWGMLPLRVLDVNVGSIPAAARNRFRYRPRPSCSWAAGVSNI